MKDAPCLNCLDREMNCHSSCNKYKEYKDTRNIINARKSENIMMNLHVQDTMKRFSGRVISEK